MTGRTRGRPRGRPKGSVGRGRGRGRACQTDTSNMSSSPRARGAGSARRSSNSHGGGFAQHPGAPAPSYPYGPVSSSLLEQAPGLPQHRLSQQTYLPHDTCPMPRYSSSSHSKSPVHPESGASTHSRVNSGTQASWQSSMQGGGYSSGSRPAQDMTYSRQVSGGGQGNGDPMPYSRQDVDFPQHLARHSSSNLDQQQERPTARKMHRTSREFPYQHEFEPTYSSHKEKRFSGGLRHDKDPPSSYSGRQGGLGDKASLGKCPDKDVPLQRAQFHGVEPSYQKQQRSSSEHRHDREQQYSNRRPAERDPSYDSPSRPDRVALYQGAARQDGLAPLYDPRQDRAQPYDAPPRSARVPPYEAVHRQDRLQPYDISPSQDGDPLYVTSRQQKDPSYDSALRHDRDQHSSSRHDRNQYQTSSRRDRDSSAGSQHADVVMPRSSSTDSCQSFGSQYTERDASPHFSQSPSTCYGQHSGGPYCGHDSRNHSLERDCELSAKHGNEEQYPPYCPPPLVQPSAEIFPVESGSRHSQRDPMFNNGTTGFSSSELRGSGLPKSSRSGGKHSKSTKSSKSSASYPCYGNPVDCAAADQYSQPVSPYPDVSNPQCPPPALEPARWFGRGPADPSWKKVTDTQGNHGKSCSSERAANAQPERGRALTSSRKKQSNCSRDSSPYAASPAHFSKATCPPHPPYAANVSDASSDRSLMSLSKEFKGKDKAASLPSPDDEYINFRMPGDQSFSTQPPRESPQRTPRQRRPSTPSSPPPSPYAPRPPTPPLYIPPRPLSPPAPSFASLPSSFASLPSSFASLPSPGPTPPNHQQFPLTADGPRRRRNSRSLDTFNPDDNGLSRKHAQTSPSLPSGARSSTENLDNPPLSEPPPLAAEPMLWQQQYLNHLQQQKHQMQEEQSPEERSQGQNSPISEQASQPGQIQDEFRTSHSMKEKESMQREYIRFQLENMQKEHLKQQEDMRQDHLIRLQQLQNEHVKQQEDLTSQRKHGKHTHNARAEYVSREKEKLLRKQGKQEEKMRKEQMKQQEQLQIEHMKLQQEFLQQEHLKLHEFMRQEPQRTQGPLAKQSKAQKQQRQTQRQLKEEEQGSKHHQLSDYNQHHRGNINQQPQVVQHDNGMSYCQHQSQCKQSQNLQQMQPAFSSFGPNQQQAVHQNELFYPSQQQYPQQNAQYHHQKQLPQQTQQALPKQTPVPPWCQDPTPVAGAMHVTRPLDSPVAGKGKQTVSSSTQSGNGGQAYPSSKPFHPQNNQTASQYHDQIPMPVCQHLGQTVAAAANGQYMNPDQAQHAPQLSNTAQDPSAAQTQCHGPYQAGQGSSQMTHQTGQTFHMNIPHVLAPVETHVSTSKAPPWLQDHVLFTTKLPPWQVQTENMIMVTGQEPVVTGAQQFQVPVASSARIHMSAHQQGVAMSETPYLMSVSSLPGQTQVLHQTNAEQLSITAQQPAIPDLISSEQQHNLPRSDSYDINDRSYEDSVYTCVSTSHDQGHGEPDHQTLLSHLPGPSVGQYQSLRAMGQPRMPLNQFHTQQTPTHAHHYSVQRPDDSATRPRTFLPQTLRRSTDVMSQYQGIHSMPTSDQECAHQVLVEALNQQSHSQASNVHTGLTHAVMDQHGASEQVQTQVAASPSTPDVHQQPRVGSCRSQTYTLHHLMDDSNKLEPQTRRMPSSQSLHPNVEHTYHARHEHKQERAEQPEVEPTHRIIPGNPLDTAVAMLNFPDNVLDIPMIEQHQVFVLDPPGIGLNSRQQQPPGLVASSDSEVRRNSWHTPEHSMAGSRSGSSADDDAALVIDLNTELGEVDDDEDDIFSSGPQQGPIPICTPESLLKSTVCPNSEALNDLGLRISSVFSLAITPVKKRRTLSDSVLQRVEVVTRMQDSATGPVFDGTEIKSFNNHKNLSIDQLQMQDLGLSGLSLDFPVSRDQKELCVLDGIPGFNGFSSDPLAELTKLLFSDAPVPSPGTPAAEDWNLNEAAAISFEADSVCVPGTPQRGDPERLNTPLPQLFTPRPPPPSTPRPQYFKDPGTPYSRLVPQTQCMKPPAMPLPACAKDNKEPRSSIPNHSPCDTKEQMFPLPNPSKELKDDNKLLPSCAMGPSAALLNVPVKPKDSHFLLPQCAKSSCSQRSSSGSQTSNGYNEDPDGFEPVMDIRDNVFEKGITENVRGTSKQQPQKQPPDDKSSEQTSNCSYKPSNGNMHEKTVTRQSGKRSGRQTRKETLKTDTKNVRVECVPEKSGTENDIRSRVKENWERRCVAKNSSTSSEQRHRAFDQQTRNSSVSSRSASDREWQHRLHPTQCQSASQTKGEDEDERKGCGVRGRRGLTMAGKRRLVSRERMNSSCDDASPERHQLAAADSRTETAEAPAKTQGEHVTDNERDKDTGCNFRSMSDDIDNKHNECHDMNQEECHDMNQDECHDMNQEECHDMNQEECHDMNQDECHDMNQQVFFPSLSRSNSTDSSTTGGDVDHSCAKERRISSSSNESSSSRASNVSNCAGMEESMSDLILPVVHPPSRRQRRLENQAAERSGFISATYHEHKLRCVQLEGQTYVFHDELLAKCFPGLSPTVVDKARRRDLNLLTRTLTSLDSCDTPGNRGDPVPVLAIPDANRLLHFFHSKMGCPGRGCKLTMCDQKHRGKIQSDSPKSRKRNDNVTETVEHGSNTAQNVTRRKPGKPGRAENGEDNEDYSGPEYDVQEDSQSCSSDKTLPYCDGHPVMSWEEELPEKVDGAINDAEHDACHLTPVHALSAKYRRHSSEYESRARKLRENGGLPRGQFPNSSDEFFLGGASPMLPPMPSYIASPFTPNSLFNVPTDNERVLLECFSAPGSQAPSSVRSAPSVRLPSPDHPDLPHFDEDLFEGLSNHKLGSDSDALHTYVESRASHVESRASQVVPHRGIARKGMGRFEESHVDCRTSLGERHDSTDGPDVNSPAESDGEEADDVFVEEGTLPKEAKQDYRCAESVRHKQRDVGVISHQIVSERSIEVGEAYQVKVTKELTRWSEMRTKHAVKSYTVLPASISDRESFRKRQLPCVKDQPKFPSKIMSSEAMLARDLDEKLNAIVSGRNETDDADQGHRQKYGFTQLTTPSISETNTHIVDLAPPLDSDDNPSTGSSARSSVSDDAGLVGMTSPVLSSETSRTQLLPGPALSIERKSSGTTIAYGASSSDDETDENCNSGKSEIKSASGKSTLPWPLSQSSTGPPELSTPHGSVHTNMSPHTSPPQMERMASHGSFPVPIEKEEDEGREKDCDSIDDEEEENHDEIRPPDRVDESLEDRVQDFITHGSQFTQRAVVRSNSLPDLCAAETLAVPPKKCDENSCHNPGPIASRSNSFPGAPSNDVKYKDSGSGEEQRHVKYKDSGSGEEQRHVNSVPSPSTINIVGESDDNSSDLSGFVKDTAAVSHMCEKKKQKSSTNVSPTYEQQRNAGHLNNNMVPDNAGPKTGKRKSSDTKSTKSSATDRSETSAASSRSSPKNKHENLVSPSSVPSKQEYKTPNAKNSKKHEQSDISCPASAKEKHKTSRPTSAKAKHETSSNSSSASTKHEHMLTEASPTSVKETEKISPTIASPPTNGKHKASVFPSQTKKYEVSGTASLTSTKMTDTTSTACSLFAKETPETANALRQMFPKSTKQKHESSGSSSPTSPKKKQKTLVIPSSPSMKEKNGTSPPICSHHQWSDDKHKMPVITSQTSAKKQKRSGVCGPTSVKEYSTSAVACLSSAKERQETSAALSNTSVQHSQHLSFHLSTKPAKEKPNGLSSFSPTSAKERKDRPSTSSPTSAKERKDRPTVSNPTSTKERKDRPSTSSPNSVKERKDRPSISNPTSAKERKDRPSTSNLTSAKERKDRPSTSNPTSASAKEVKDRSSTSNPTSPKEGKDRPSTSNPTSAKGSRDRPSTFRSASAKEMPDRPSTSSPTSARDMQGRPYTFCPESERGMQGKSSASTSAAENPPTSPVTDSSNPSLDVPECMMAEPDNITTVKESSTKVSPCRGAEEECGGGEPLFEWAVPCAAHGSVFCSCEGIDVATVNEVPASPRVGPWLCTPGTPAPGTPFCDYSKLIYSPFPVEQGMTPARHEPGMTPARHVPGMTPARHEPGMTPARHEPGMTPARHDPGMTPARHDPGMTPARHDPGMTPTKPDPVTTSGVHGSLGGVGGVKRLAPSNGQPAAKRRSCSPLDLGDDDHKDIYGSSIDVKTSSGPSASVTDATKNGGECYAARGVTVEANDANNKSGNANDANDANNKSGNANDANNKSGDACGNTRSRLIEREKINLGHVSRRNLGPPGTVAENKEAPFQADEKRELVASAGKCERNVASQSATDATGWKVTRSEFPTDGMVAVETNSVLKDSVSYTFRAQCVKTADTDSNQRNSDRHAGQQVHTRSSAEPATAATQVLISSSLLGEDRSNPGKSSVESRHNGVCSVMDTMQSWTGAHTAVDSLLPDKSSERDTKSSVAARFNLSSKETTPADVSDASSVDTTDGESTTEDTRIIALGDFLESDVNLTSEDSVDSVEAVRLSPEPASGRKLQSPLESKKKLTIPEYKERRSKGVIQSESVLPQVCVASDSEDNNRQRVAGTLGQGTRSLQEKGVSHTTSPTSVSTPTSTSSLTNMALSRLCLASGEPGPRMHRTESVPAETSRKVAVPLKRSSSFHGQQPTTKRFKEERDDWMDWSRSLEPAEHARDVPSHTREAAITSKGRRLTSDEGLRTSLTSPRSLSSSADMKRKKEGQRAREEKKTGGCADYEKNIETVVTSGEVMNFVGTSSERARNEDRDTRGTKKEENSDLDLDSVAQKHAQVEVGVSASEDGGNVSSDVDSTENTNSRHCPERTETILEAEQDSESVDSVLGKISDETELDLLLPPESTGQEQRTPSTAVQTQSTSRLMQDGKETILCQVEGSPRLLLEEMDLFPVQDERTSTSAQNEAGLSCGLLLGSARDERTLTSTQDGRNPIPVQNNKVQDTQVASSARDESSLTPSTMADETMSILKQDNGTPTWTLDLLTSLPLQDQVQSASPVHDQLVPIQDTWTLSPTQDGAKSTPIQDTWTHSPTQDGAKSTPIQDTWTHSPTRDGAKSTPIQDERMSTMTHVESIPTMAHDERILTMARDDSIPFMANDEIIPTKTQDESIPTMARDESIPSMALDERILTMAHEESIPTTTQDESIPAMAHDKSIPTQTQDEKIPTMARYESIPTMALGERIAAVAHDESIPTLAHDESIPTQTQDERMPALTQDKILPTRPHNEKMVTGTHDEMLSCADLNETMPTRTSSESCSAPLQVAGRNTCMTVGSTPVAGAEEPDTCITVGSTPVTGAEEPDTCITVGSTPVASAEEPHTCMTVGSTLMSGAEEPDTCITVGSKPVAGAEEPDTCITVGSTPVTGAEEPDTCMTVGSTLMSGADEPDTCITVGSTPVAGAEEPDTCITVGSTPVTGAEEPHTCLTVGSTPVTGAEEPHTCLTVGSTPVTGAEEPDTCITVGSTPVTGAEEPDACITVGSTHVTGAEEPDTCLTVGSTPVTGAEEPDTCITVASTPVAGAEEPDTCMTVGSTPVTGAEEPNTCMTVGSTPVTGAEEPDTCMTVGSTPMSAAKEPVTCLTFGSTPVTGAEEPDTCISVGSTPVACAEEPDTCITVGSTPVTGAEEPDTCLTDDSTPVTGAEEPDTCITVDSTPVTGAEEPDTCLTVCSTPVTGAEEPDACITVGITHVTGAEEPDTCLTVGSTPVTGAEEPDTCLAVASTPVAGAEEPDTCMTVGSTPMSGAEEPDTCLTFGSTPVAGAEEPHTCITVGSTPVAGAEEPDTCITVGSTPVAGAEEPDTCITVGSTPVTGAEEPDTCITVGSTPVAGAEEPDTCLTVGSTPVAGAEEPHTCITVGSTPVTGAEEPDTCMTVGSTPVAGAELPDSRSSTPTLDERMPIYEDREVGTGDQLPESHKMTTHLRSNVGSKCVTLVSDPSCTETLVDKLFQPDVEPAAASDQTDCKQNAEIAMDLSGQSTCETTPPSANKAPVSSSTITTCQTISAPVTKDSPVSSSTITTCQTISAPVTKDSPVSSSTITTCQPISAPVTKDSPISSSTITTCQPTSAPVTKDLPISSSTITTCQPISAPVTNKAPAILVPSQTVLRPVKNDEVLPSSATCALMEASRDCHAGADTFSTTTTTVNTTCVSNVPDQLTILLQEKERMLAEFRQRALELERTVKDLRVELLETKKKDNS